MPGICGIVDLTGAASLAAAIDGMLARIKHHPWYRVESRADASAGVGLGRVSLGIVNTAPQPVAAQDGLTLAVMDGELYDYDAQRRVLESAGCVFRSASHAEVLLHGYRQHGKSFFRTLNGKFQAAIWDAACRCLVLTNDRFGMRPLYYAKLPGKLLVASEIKAILTCADVPRSVNVRGIAQFLSYGQYLGHDTSLDAVRVLPPAAWVTFDLAQDRLDVERYWQLGEGLQDGRTPAELLARIDSAFKLAVDRRTLGTAGLGLSLSGGLDARTILGVMDHDQVEVTSIALGIEGCRDHRSATQLAALTNRRHHNYTLGEGFLDHYEQHLDQMVHLTDGQYLSQCIVMPTLPYYRELGVQVLVRGHAGELMHMTKAYNFSLDPAALAIATPAQLEDWTFGHLRAFMLEGVEGSILTAADPNELNSLARESLRDCLRESAGLEPPVQRISHLFVTQRSRRETALALVKFGSLLETRLPYLDNDVVDLLLTAPPTMKLAETIQGHILRRRRPEFLDVVNVNTGTRIGASRLARRLATFRQRVLSKLRVRGYQPYERLGLWLRRELRPLVEKILLDDRCLERGIFQPDTLRNVVQQHFENHRNHTYLLMALLVLEKGQRKFIDADA
jgi:asparagine synthase (glutamine-hydrolysing)